MSVQKRILYVEDDEDTAHVVKLILEPLGHHVDIAPTGSDGLSMIRGSDYDLVILDVMLPDISGIQLFHTAHRESLCSSAKFAFLSITYIPDHTRRELIDLGVADFIPKPFDRDELLCRVKDLLV